MASHGRCLGMAQSCSISVRHMHPCRPRSRAVIRAAAAANWDAIYAGESLPAAFAGPVAVQEVPGGKGRGLVATRDITPGELLLVDTPLVYMTADEEGKLPELNQLIELAVTQPATPEQLAWWSALDAGPDLPAPDWPGQLLLLPTGTPTTPQRASPTATNHSNWHPTKLDRARAAMAIKLNSCEGATDEALCLSRGTSCTRFRGLWRAFDLMNHSCVPTANWYLIEDRMVVRAARQIATGEEVTISYIITLQPVAQRQHKLQTTWGFQCQCQRCQAESQRALLAAVQELNEKVHDDLAPLVQQWRRRTASADHHAKLVQEAQALFDLLHAFDDELRTLSQPELADFLRASCFSAYVMAELLIVAITDDATPVDGAASKERAAAGCGGSGAQEPVDRHQDVLALKLDMLNALSTVEPGSVHHVVCAVEVAELLRQCQGAAGADTVQAQAAVQEALRCRYGSKVSQHTLDGLLAAVKKAWTQNNNIWLAFLPPLLI